MITENKEKADLYSDWANLISGPKLNFGELFDPDQVHGHYLRQGSKHGIIGTRRRKAERGKAADSLIEKYSSELCFSNEAVCFKWSCLFNVC